MIFSRFFLIVSKTLLGLSLGLSLVFFLISCNASNQEELVTDNPLIIKHKSNFANVAHRGGSEVYPEESLEAFQYAVDNNVEFLEMDIRITRDNELVLHHDSSINRTSGGDGLINDYSLAELKKFNFGFYYSNNKGNFPYRKNPIRIATLEEVFTKFPNQMMIIEIKNTGEKGKMSSLLLKTLISRHNMANKVIIAAFSGSIIDYFVEITDNQIPTVASQSEALKFYISMILRMDFLYHPQAKLLALPTSFLGLNLATRELIFHAHRRNLAVHYWTIDDPVEMKELIEIGADGIMTDNPSILKKIIEEYPIK